MNTDSQPFPSELQRSIQQSLQDIASQMGRSLNESAAEQLYRNASDLLNHISHEPLTLARVAGTLLVYKVQNTELEELAWFRSQLQQCSDAEEVEELIESIHRVDAL
jgi:sensor domain CHASE-containing protein